MRGIKFTTGHMIYNHAFNQILQTTETLDYLSLVLLVIQISLMILLKGFLVILQVTYEVSEILLRTVNIYLR